MSLSSHTEVFAAGPHPEGGTFLAVACRSKATFAMPSEAGGHHHTPKTHTHSLSLSVCFLVGIGANAGAGAAVVGGEGGMQPEPNRVSPKKWARVSWPYVCPYVPTMCV
jgi:hypothetical protein